MRLNDNLVVQFVSPDKMVFVNDSTGQEVVRSLTIEGTGELLGSALTANSKREAMDVDGVIIPPSALIHLAYAVGYFSRSVDE